MAIVLTVIQDSRLRPAHFPPRFPAIYDRISQKIERIPIYDNHSHPGFADDSDVTPWPPRPKRVVFFVCATTSEFVHRGKALFAIPTTISNLSIPNGLRKKESR